MTREIKLGNIHTKLVSTVGLKMKLKDINCCKQNTDFINGREILLLYVWAFDGVFSHLWRLYQVQS